MSSFVRLAQSAVQIYQEQGSCKHAVRYMFKYIARRGPTAMTRVLSRQAVGRQLKALSRTNGTSLAILISGGIGDLVVAARYMRDFQKTAGPFTYDVFSSQPAIAEWIFRFAPDVGRHFLDAQFQTASHHYNVALFLSSFIQVQRSSLPESVGRPTALTEALANITNSCADIQYCIDNHPNMDGYLAQRLTFRNVTRANSLHSMSGTLYGGDHFQLPSNPRAISTFGLAGSDYVTVHNGFEVQNVISGTRSTKCYPHFGQVVLKLREQFPEIRFVQLGSKTSAGIPSVHQNLISKTTLEEASSLVAGALCHLDNESGLVHIASCHGTPCCVVFGPTSADYFGYKNNVNLRPTLCGNCWWTTNNWMDRCPREFPEPVCTYLQSPFVVADAASALIRKLRDRAA